jgi:excisionase family DNA binding protein
MPSSAPAISLLTPQEAAELLRTPVKTLERWRHVGGGPCFLKLGRRVCYRLADLEAWLEQRRREHTSVDPAA